MFAGFGNVEFGFGLTKKKILSRGHKAARDISAISGHLKCIHKKV